MASKSKKLVTTLVKVQAHGSGQLNLLHLPVELIEHILSFLTYDEIAHLRAVCRTLNLCASQLLNRGFIKVEKYHSQCLKRVKSKLPRRESERRNHPLAKHCDVLSAIETRLSLLGMTYMKYVDMSLCCFIPGKVIDEIYRVLRIIQNNPNPPRVHELLQELRDISSMAMEYFEEKIAPNLKHKLSSPNCNLIAAVAAAAVQSPFRTIASGQAPTYNAYNNSTRFPKPDDLSKLQQQIRHVNVSLKRDISDCKAKMKENEKQIKEQSQLIAEQNVRIAEQEGRLNEMRQKLLEFERRYSTPAVIDETHLSKKAKDLKDIIQIDELSLQSVPSDAVGSSKILTRSQIKRKFSIDGATSSTSYKRLASAEVDKSKKKVKTCHNQG